MGSAVRWVASRVQLTAIAARTTAAVVSAPRVLKVSRVKHAMLMVIVPRPPVVTERAAAQAVAVRARLVIQTPIVATAVGRAELASVGHLLVTIATWMTCVQVGRAKAASAAQARQCG
jgi:hypothetical protein